jgi:hypothetical protein
VDYFEKQSKKIKCLTAVRGKALPQYQEMSAIEHRPMRAFEDKSVPESFGGTGGLTPKIAPAPKANAHP